MKRILFGFFCLVLVWGICAECQAGRSIVVTDMAGREVAAPLDPERIICLGPGALRMIVYLRAESKVVGVETMEKRHPGGRPYWMAHPELAALPDCGPGGPAGINKKPDMEAVLSVRPQVIFTAYMAGALAAEMQGKLGIPVLVLSYGESPALDGALFGSLRMAGKVLNREERAESVVKYIGSLRRDLRARTRGFEPKPKPSVYVGGLGYRGVHGIQSTSKDYAPFVWLNANNAVKGIKAGFGGHVFMDKEKLLSLNPRFIFIDGAGLPLVEKDYLKKPEYYSSLRAFASGRVRALFPFNWYATNIGTALVDAYAIGKYVFRDQFADLNPVQKADEIYRFLVGAPVYGQLAKAYGPLGRVIQFKGMKNKGD